MLLVLSFCFTYPPRQKVGLVTNPLGKAYTIFSLADDEPEIDSILKNLTVGHREAARQISAHGFKISEASVRKFRSRNKLGKLKTPLTESSKDPEDTFYAITGDEGELSVGRGQIPVELNEDFSPLLEFFGLSPEVFRVIDDTVRVSKWQTSKRTENGDRDVIWLWSYKARFAKKLDGAVRSQEDMENAIKQVQAWKPLIRKTLGIGLGEPSTYAHVQGDEQGGKSAGGGIEGLELREADALQQSYDRIQALLKRGANIECIADVVTGDKIENIFGHYPSQAKTTSTLRSQMSYARQSEIRKTRAFAEFGIPVKKVYTPSNHGEIRQSIGSSPFTSESDNYDLIIAEQVKEVIDESSLAGQVEWFIPHDDWWTFFDLSGIQCALTHGHKADRKGAIEKWALGQRDLFHYHHNIRTQIMFMGHKHHGFIKDIGGTILVQSPSLDGGSSYFEAGFGNRSTHGIITLLVGSGFRFGWSDAVML